MNQSTPGASHDALYDGPLQANAGSAQSSLLDVSGFARCRVAGLVRACWLSHAMGSVPVSMLAIRTDFPDPLLSAPARELRRLIGQPTLFHLPGRRRDSLFVSVLLHGNEDVGWRAVQAVLKSHRTQGLPRDLSLFVGNVAAAEANQRRLAGQPDYNRVWPGAEDGGTPEHELMQRVFEEMSSRPLFASADLHNNTGLNPFYGCVNRTDAPTLHLATMFSRTVVYYERPKGVQSRAFSRLCPAVTCECGKVGHSAGVEHAAEFLRACLHLADLPRHPVPKGDLRLFRTVATVYVPRHTSFGFGEMMDADLQLPSQMEQWNFQELPPGTILGRRKAATSASLCVRDLKDSDVTSRYLAWESDALVLRRPVIPAMFTLNHQVIEQDCLGYFMERCQLTRDATLPPSPRNRPPAGLL
jgi:succinylglutamate desuccinylase